MKRKNFVHTKQLEVYLGFKGIVEITYLYEGTSEKHGEQFQWQYLEAVSLPTGLLEKRNDHGYVDRR